MAGGMNRRGGGDKVSLHERIHGTTSPAQPKSVPARAGSPQMRQCWVTEEHGRLPALLLEWRRTVSGWQGRVVRPVLEEDSWVVVEEWLPARTLSPHLDTCRCHPPFF